MVHLREIREDHIFYRNEIIKVIKKIHNKKLLKRIYDLAAYLYLYESDD